jgi:hypothetical protein
VAFHAHRLDDGVWPWPFVMSRMRCCRSYVEVRRLNGHFLTRVADTVTPVEVDREAHAFSQLMLDTSIKQLGAKIEQAAEGHRTDQRDAAG